jgi:hypothetical protein
MDVLAGRLGPRPLCAVAAVASAAALAANAGAVSLSKPSAPDRRAMAAIVRTWNARLNANDNAGIARLFALPTTIIQAPYVYRLETAKQVALWFSLLPCAGKVVSIAFKGRFATAVFRLADRGNTACDDPGGLAAARFEIVKGKIVSWEQVPVPKRSAGQPSAPVA